MAEFNITSFVLGILGTGFLFLIGWGSKHALDRLLLPKIIDWLSARSKKKAITRANAILKKFEEENRHSLDIRYIILRSEFRILIFVLLSCLLITVSIAFDVVLSEQFKDSFSASIFASAGYVIWIIVIIIRLNKDADLFENYEKRRIECVERLRELLGSAGFSEDEIKIWLEKVPNKNKNHVNI